MRTLSGMQIGSVEWPNQRGWCLNSEVILETFRIYRLPSGDLSRGMFVASMLAADLQVNITDQALPANSVWHYILKEISDCGLQSKGSLPCVVRIDENGDMVTDIPNRPGRLQLTRLIAGKFKLKWSYSPFYQEIKPEGFRIYMGTGGDVDYSAAHATVTYRRGVTRYSWTSAALTHGTFYTFCVRAYESGGYETFNTDAVGAYADSQGPDAITGLSVKVQQV